MVAVVEEKEEGGTMGKPPWRLMGNDAESERREADRGAGAHGSTRDEEEEEEEEGEEEVVESAYEEKEVATLRCDNSASLWGAPPPPASGETESALSPYGKGRNAAAVATAAAAAAQ